MADPIIAPDRDTAAALHPLIGRTATLWVRDMQVQVQINNVKAAYGGTRLLITPVAGSGTNWVQEESVELDS